MYSRGLGVERDPAEAFKPFRKAADAGSVAAANNLGWSYEHGEGVAVDLAQAVRWYRVAADKGLAEAEYNLAVLYKTGRGVIANAEEAVRNLGDVGRAPSSGARIFVHHKPAGLAVLVTPWNFPAAMATRKK